MILAHPKYRSMTDTLEMLDSFGFCGGQAA
jgi:hypothetical protein